MTISNNFFFRRIIHPSRLASVLILAGCALCLGLRVPVNHARTVTPANPLVAQETKLTASNGAAFHNFGRSVAMSVDTVVVGAPGDGGHSGIHGAAYVFVRSGTAWYQQAILTASDGADFDNFGASVAIDGNTAVVGAPGAGGPNGNQGAAYVFARSGTTWTLQRKLTSSDLDCFGGVVGKVAISGDTLAVGAPYAFTGPWSQGGAAYVFARNGTTWTLQQRLTAPDGVNPNNFGGSVAISGNTLVVGAPFESTEGWIQYQGTAYVFARSGTTWTQQQKLMASDRAPNEFFGNQIAISGNTVVAGVPCDKIGANPGQGSAYVFAP